MNELDVQDNDVALGDAQSKSKALAWGAVIMGVLGLGAGIAGIVIANNATRELASLSDQLANQPDPVEALQARLKDLDDRLVNVGAEVVRSNNAMRGQTETLSRLQRVVAENANETRANREQINKNTATLAALAESGVRAAPRPAPQAPTTETAATRSSSPDAGASSSPATSGDARTHVIQSGDTFARLASRYGVSLNAIVEANPGVNPNRLQIGQEIVIP